MVIRYYCLICDDHQANKYGVDLKSLVLLEYDQATQTSGLVPIKNRRVHARTGFCAKVNLQPEYRNMQQN